MYKIFMGLVLMLCLVGCGYGVDQEVDVEVVETNEGCNVRYRVCTRITKDFIAFDSIYYNFSDWITTKEELERVKTREYKKASLLLECFNDKGGE